MKLYKSQFLRYNISQRLPVSVGGKSTLEKRAQTTEREKALCQINWFVFSS